MHQRVLNQIPAAVDRDPRAANQNNVAGMDGEIIETPHGPHVDIIVRSIFGADRHLALMTGTEAIEYGRYLMNLGAEIEGR